MIRRYLMTVVALATLAICQPVTANIMIDTYTAGDTLVQVGSGFTGQTTNHPGILGGERDTVLTVPAGGSLGAIIFDGDLQIVQGNNDEISGNFLYDNFGTIDLTESGINTNFALNIDTTDLTASINNAFWITVVSDGSSSTVNFDVPTNPQYAHHITIDFTDFAGVDMTAVDSVELGFDFAGNPGAQLTIQNFFVANGVPEPSTIIFGAGMAMLSLMVPRRRKS